MGTPICTGTFSHGWRAIPRSRVPVWWLPREEMWNDVFLPTPQQLAQQTRRLREEILRRSQDGSAFL